MRWEGQRAAKIRTSLSVAFQEIVAISRHIEILDDILQGMSSSQTPSSTRR